MNTEIIWMKTGLTDKQEEYEQAQLAHAGFEGPAQDLKAFAVPTEFEYSEDSHQSDDSENSQRHRLIRTFVLKNIIPLKII